MRFIQVVFNIILFSTTGHFFRRTIS